MAKTAIHSRLKACSIQAFSL